MESPIDAVTSCFDPSGLINVTLILPLLALAFFEGLDVAAVGRRSIMRYGE